MSLLVYCHLLLAVTSVQLSLSFDFQLCWLSLSLNCQLCWLSLSLDCQLCWLSLSFDCQLDLLSLLFDCQLCLLSMSFDFLFPTFQDVISAFLQTDYMAALTMPFGL